MILKQLRFLPLLIIGLCLQRHAALGEITNTALQPETSVPKKFSVIGPVLTITLKDPFAVERDEFHSVHSDRESKLENDVGEVEPVHESQQSSRRRIFSRFLRRSHAGPAHFLGLRSLAPHLAYTIKSNSPPLPKHIPSLRHASFTASYRYDELKSKPSSIQADLKFHNRKTGFNLELEPGYAVKEKMVSCTGECLFSYFATQPIEPIGMYQGTLGVPFR